ncbi:MAG: helix-turn-helix transcriptional regulator, partial [Candidatus Xenobia bacterium]
QIEYWPPAGTSATARAIDVYHLTQSRGDWYAVAWCHLRRDLRIFALSRIKSAVPTADRYVIPADFDVKAYFRNSLGIELAGEAQEIRLRFDADQARWVCERTWHLSQAMAPQADGSLILTLQVGISTELKQWILGYGPHVEVLSPAGLRDAISADLRAAAALYETGV